MRPFSEMCRATGRVELAPKYLADTERKIVANSLEHFSEMQSLHAASRNSQHVVNFGFLEELRVNAVAIAWNNGDYIGLNFGVIRVLYSIFIEVAHRSSLPWLTTEEVKRRTVSWLFECAKEFLFWHEMGHVWNGHKAWFRRAGCRSFTKSRHSRCLTRKASTGGPSNSMQTLSQQLTSYGL